MGFNTSVIILNDGLHAIETDPDFGKKLSAAISHLSIEDGPIDVSAGGHVNAASAIETHHADGTSVVTFGQNCGRDLGLIWPYGSEAYEVRVLRDLAAKYGYCIRKKPKKK